MTRSDDGAERYAIELDQELLPLSESPRHMPRGREGRRISRCTLWRWASAGKLAVDGRRVFFPTMRWSGVSYTSKQGIAWFVARLSQRPGAGNSPGPSARRRKEQERASRELDLMMGV